MNEPRTEAGRTLLEDEPLLITGEHDMRTRILAIEAEAATIPREAPLSREALAGAGPPHPGARPWGPNGEPVNPPDDGDDNRRCWNLLLDNASGLGVQCVFYNGHPGEHRWACDE